MKRSTDSKIFAIGDIHGCHDKLVALLKRLPFDKTNDTLIFLGDYLNRGKESRKVIDTLVELKKECRNTIFLRGNHEQELLSYSETGDVETLRLLRKIGVDATTESYNVSARRLQGLACFPPEHQQFLLDLQFCHITDHYIFTHADFHEDILVPPGKTADTASYCFNMEAQLLSSRRLMEKQPTNLDKIIVFGHIPFELPLVTPDRIGIDTGAVYGNILTALELPTLCFHHA
jgi:serine/threonine protein phosphatase 1